MELRINPSELIKGESSCAIHHQHKVGGLNLSEELGNTSKAYRPRDTFYRYRQAVEDGRIVAVGADADAPYP